MAAVNAVSGNKRGLLSLAICMFATSPHGLGVQPGHALTMQLTFRPIFALFPRVGQDQGRSPCASAFDDAKGAATDDRRRSGLLFQGSRLSVRLLYGGETTTESVALRICTSPEHFGQDGAFVKRRFMVLL
jgi:hypothetical protein